SRLRPAPRGILRRSGPRRLRRAGVGPPVALRRPLGRFRLVSATALVALACLACGPREAALNARNDTMTAMIVRLVVPPAEEGSGPPQFLDYVIPPASTRQIPAPEGPPA